MDINESTNSIGARDSMMKFVIDNKQIEVAFDGRSKRNLVARVPATKEKYQLSLCAIKKFLREIMAIPHLHNEDMNSKELCVYWTHLARKFQLPSEVCQAFWQFFVDDVSRLDKIASLEILMQNSHTTMGVWTIDTHLFSIFEQLAKTQKWHKNIDELPNLLEDIFDHVDLDAIIAKNSSVTIPLEILRKYSHITNIVGVFNAFTNVFIAFMSALEWGVYNPWPQKWWRVLCKLKSLVNICYKDKKVLNYIIGNRVNMEIIRCSRKKNTIGASSAQKLSEKSISKLEISSRLHRGINIMDNSLVEKNASTLEISSRLHLHALMSSIRRNPDIYCRCSLQRKQAAWQRIASDMNSSAEDCVEAFKHAYKYYRCVVARDPQNHCSLNRMFFKPLTDIEKDVNTMMNGIQRTEQDNTDVVYMGEEKDEFVLPQRFIPDIRMETDDVVLVMKSWACAVQNLKMLPSNRMEEKLFLIFKKYSQLTEK